MRTSSWFGSLHLSTTYIDIIVIFYILILWNNHQNKKNDFKLKTSNSVLSRTIEIFQNVVYSSYFDYLHSILALHNRGE